MKVNVREFGHKAWGWLYEKSNYISGGAAIILSAIDISNIDDNEIVIYQTTIAYGKIIYYVSLFLAVVFGYCGIEKAKSVEKLENDVAEKGDKIANLESSLNESIESMNSLFNSYLALITKTLEFKHTERISVYKIFDDSFILIGRSSDNPTLNRKSRGKYPLSEGFISKGWEEGSFFIDSLPDPSDAKGLAEYYRRVNTVKPIPKETVLSIGMKSRTYYIYRISGQDDKPKAIFVAESLKETAFNENDVKQKLAEVEKALILFIERNSGVVPEINPVGL